MKQFFSQFLGRQTVFVLVAGFAALVLGGCSDNKSNSRKPIPVGYVQFYNASPDSPATQFSIKDAADNSLSFRTNFGGVTPLTSLIPATYTLSIGHANPAAPATNLVLHTEEFSTVKDEFSMWIMSGGFVAPDFFRYDYTRPKRYDSGQFGVTAFNLTQGRGQLELYYVADAGSFDSATFLATFSEGSHSEPVSIPEGKYTFFVVDVDSGNRILTTKDIPFAKAKTYFLMLREVGYGDGSTVVLDQMTESSVVYSYEDQVTQVPAKVSAYNSIDGLSPVDVLFTSDSQSASINALAADTLSNAISLTPGSYDLSMTAVNDPLTIHFSALARSLTAGTNSILFFLPNAENVVFGFELNQPQRHRLYEGDVNFVSLANKQKVVDDKPVLDRLSLYFVNEETGEKFIVPDPEDANATVIAPTAKHKLLNLGYPYFNDFSLLEGNYVLYLTYTTTVDTKSVLNQFADPLSLTVQAGQNYLLTLEPDASATDGYLLKIVN